jgi:hypothetical protein
VDRRKLAFAVHTRLSALSRSAELGDDAADAVVARRIALMAAMVRRKYMLCLCEPDSV